MRKFIQNLRFQINAILSLKKNNKIKRFTNGLVTFELFWLNLQKQHLHSKINLLYKLHHVSNGKNGTLNGNKFISFFVCLFLSLYAYLN